ncbi:MAG: energy-coupling factor transporter ATPase [Acutalibacteraceae bacterium]
MNESFIEFKNVTYTYEPEEQDAVKPSPALCNINLSVGRGEFVAVLGHNGSGKSTLAKLTNAILIPESGTVTVDGIDTSDESRVTDIRRRVGMVFQNPDNQIVATIVEDDVAFGPENLGVEPDEIRRRVDDALKAVDMYDYRLREPHKLSGGQKQRVAIAGIIAMQTGCIVLDEPTAMLDPKGRREVFDTVRRLNREMGITVLFVTHFMDEAVKADRVIVIDSGRLRLDGTPREVFSQTELLRGFGLDVPQSTELSHRLIEKGIDLPKDILDADECVEALARVMEVSR